MGRVDTYGGERGECRLIVTVFEFLNAFLEFHAPNLCHFCDKHDRGLEGRSWSELTRLYLATPNSGVHTKVNNIPLHIQWSYDAFD